MEQFQLIITNLETGETLVDINTNAIIGAVDKGENGTRGICFTHCKDLDLAATAAGALQAANHATENMPKSIRRAVKRLGNHKI